MQRISKQVEWHLEWFVDAAGRRVQKEYLISQKEFTLKEWKYDLCWQILF